VTPKRAHSQSRPAGEEREGADRLRARRTAPTINMASAGVGSQSHLSGVLFMSMADFESLIVPHKGGGPSVNSVVAGQTHWTFTPAPAVMSFIKNGRLRAARAQPAAALGDARRHSRSPTPSRDTTTAAGRACRPQGHAAGCHRQAARRPCEDARSCRSEGRPREAGRRGVHGLPEDFRKFLAQDQGNTVKVIKAAQAAGRIGARGETRLNRRVTPISLSGSQGGDLGKHAQDHDREEHAQHVGNRAPHDARDRHVRRDRADDVDVQAPPAGGSGRSPC